jgi:hypothetical protein
MTRHGAQQRHVAALAATRGNANHAHRNVSGDAPKGDRGGGTARGDRDTPWDSGRLGTRERQLADARGLLGHVDAPRRSGRNAERGAGGIASAEPGLGAPFFLPFRASAPHPCAPSRLLLCTLSSDYIILHYRRRLSLRRFPQFGQHLLRYCALPAAAAVCP